ncbi:hypothetical protein C5167_016145 [Papaver somniferum]|nr:hypothetical protein C5167_016145 [Papaver somniferum]
MFKSGRQGIVRQIYKGNIFVYDSENDLENGGYFCAKCQMCEKIKLFNGCQDIDVPQGLQIQQHFRNLLNHLDWHDRQEGKTTKSVRSQLLISCIFQAVNNNRQGREGAFSIGQTLRIRIGPLKGHLCRVIAIYQTDVTVKIDYHLANNAKRFCIHGVQSKSLYAKATNAGVDPKVAAKRLKIEWDTTAEIDDVRLVTK